MRGHDERETKTKVRTVAGTQLGAAGKTAEDFDSPPIISHELHGDEPLPCQKIQPCDQGLAGCDQPRP